MLNKIYTIKQRTSQAFVGQKRVPTTILLAQKQVVVDLKDAAKDGYTAVKLAVGQKRVALKKPQASAYKDLKLTSNPRWFKEVRTADTSVFTKGQELVISDIISAGDVVKASGISKGKGFAGGMKRHGFHGGPRTHGQSDRARAPGSIGRGTTPGRVVKGQKMAGHLGSATSSVRNLKVLAVDPQTNIVTLKGLIPGANSSLVTLTITKKAPHDQS